MGKSIRQHGLQGKGTIHAPFLRPAFGASPCILVTLKQGDHTS